MAPVISDIGAHIFSGLLAAGDPNPTPSGALLTPPPDIDPNSVTPGMWGFIAFLFLIVVAILLYFSLRKQLKKVDFPEDAPASTTGTRDMDPSPRIPD